MVGELIGVNACRPKYWKELTDSEKLEKNEFWAVIESRFTIDNFPKYANITIRKTKPQLEDVFKVVKVVVKEVK